MSSVLLGERLKLFLKGLKQIQTIEHTPRRLDEKKTSDIYMHFENTKEIDFFSPSNQNWKKEILDIKNISSKKIPLSKKKEALNLLKRVFLNF